MSSIDLQDPQRQARNDEPERVARNDTPEVEGHVVADAQDPQRQARNDEMSLDEKGRQARQA
jgi:hypothetical protein